MAKRTKSDSIRIPEATLSFPNLLEPRSFNGSDPKYGATFIFEEGTDLSELEAAVVEVAKREWKGKKPKNYRSPFRDGAEKAHLDGYEAGMTFISASSKRRPGIVGPDARTRIEDPEQLYPGCIVMAEVVAYAYDVAGNQGVAFGLNSVQKRREGPPLGSHSRAEDVYDAVENWDESESDSDEKIAPDTETDPDFLRS